MNNPKLGDSISLRDSPGPGPAPIGIRGVASVVPDNYPDRDLAWGESYYLSSLLVRFENSLNPLDVNEFFQRSAQVILKRDDNSQRFSKEATWTYRTLYEPGFGGAAVNCSNAGIDGMILTPFSEFLSLYRQRPELFASAGVSTVELESTRSKLQTAIQEVIDYHQRKSWNSTVGTYQTHIDCAEVDSRNRRGRDFTRLPFNLIAAMGRVHFRLYLESGDPVELKRATSIANDLKSWFKYGPLGELYWPYFYADSDPEDRSHGVIVADFIKLLAEHGVVFNWETVSALDKTIRFQILGSSNVVMDYIGERKDVSSGCSDPANQVDYFKCRDLAQWLPFIAYKNWTDLAKSYIHIDSGSYGLLAEALQKKFTRTKTENQTCSHEGECSTSSCLGKGTCGEKIKFGGTCRKDSDCYSGQCFAGVVCGNPLGAGSTCTRHHECVSGLCLKNGMSAICQ